MRNKVNLNGGISLIVLVITIVVIIILAAAVILTLGDNNPIESARRAAIVSTISSFRDELSLNVANKSLSEMLINNSEINLDGEGMLELIPTMKDQKIGNMEYKDILEIKNGNLVFKSDISGISTQDRVAITEMLTNSVSGRMGYVQRGLVLHLDAKTNNGIGHNNNTEKWIDLSGNGNDGALKGDLELPIWNDEYLTFDGTKKWVDLRTRNYEKFTLEACFKITEKTDNTQMCIVGNWQDAGYGIVCYVDENRLQTSIYINGKYVAAKKDINLINNQIKASQVFDGKNITLYINGEKIDSVAVDGEIILPSNDVILAIGANPANNGDVSLGYLKGNVYYVRCYDVALTEDEVKQNYYIDELLY